MAYDETYADILRNALNGHMGVTERKMFGGLCFMLNGNMLCGIAKTSAMFRVGKELEETALKIEGIAPLSFTGRPMGGMVEAEFELLEDDARRDQALALAMRFVSGLPAK